MSTQFEEIPHTEGFTLVPTSWACNRSLTRKARGLLAEVLSYGSGKTITLNDLIDNGVEGRDSVQSMLDELLAKGYLTRKEPRHKTGRFAGSSYAISSPLSKPSSTLESEGADR